MDIRTERLQQAFRSSKYTQTELCEKTGITKGALSSYLSGRYFPKQVALEQLSNALDVSITYLMGIDDNQRNEVSVAHSPEAPFDYVVTTPSAVFNIECKQPSITRGILEKRSILFSRLLSYSDEELADLVKYMEFIESKR